MKGKNAIVTGSTSGIGLGIARALGAAGANLMINGFGEAAQIETLRAGLAREFGVEVGYSGADMSKPDQIRQMVAAAEKELGSVDIVVNNAGIQHTAPVERFPPERWDAVICCGGNNGGRLRRSRQRADPAAARPFSSLARGDCREVD